MSALITERRLDFGILAVEPHRSASAAFLRKRPPGLALETACLATPKILGCLACARALEDCLARANLLLRRRLQGLAFVSLGLASAKHLTLVVIRMLLEAQLVSAYLLSKAGAWLAPSV